MLTYFCILLPKTVSSPGLIIKNWKEKDGRGDVEISRLIVSLVSLTYSPFRDVSPEKAFSGS